MIVLICRPDKIEMTDPERASNGLQCFDRGVPFAPLEIAQILLADIGALGDLLLRQAAGRPQAREVFSDQLSHLHAITNRGIRALSLSTIICKWIVGYSTGGGE